MIFMADMAHVRHDLMADLMAVFQDQWEIFRIQQMELR